MVQKITGGVCAAQGFTAGATRCGVKASSAKDDTAILYASVPCTAAATYTKNRVKAAPLQVTREHLENGRAQAVVVNSGNANACAPDGLENARREAAAAAKLLGIPEEDVVVASTGVIGQRINIECIEENIGKIILSQDGSEAANIAIMTTDTTQKTEACEFTAGGKTCRIGGICKGSGMIHPNMGTMLAFVTTDCAIAGGLLQETLREVVKGSFNCVSVDGDTSTNDMCVVLSSGLAGNAEIQERDEDWQAFREALAMVCTSLARQIAADGEGASRLITCNVCGARDNDTATVLAKAVCSSSLLKAAMFGADANWGRVLCAMGYSGAEFDPEKVDVDFSSDKGKISVCKAGRAVDFDEGKAKEILLRPEVTIDIDVHEAGGSAVAWGCDLTYDYVKINGDYRT
ncbi:MAG: bifunctional glutamate N-acetyltransferase/amino-acid acetyltransferase ArgJ [Clostridiaceae bacterium]|nr:bifunctional glutamate N-acetyltransferase/amino-acid acetyltransferase ArgJ [Clostridiaceae bacterium]